MTLLTQVEIEQRMYDGGIARATSMMDRAEESGNASRNPYAKQIYRDYVLPLAARIREDTAQRTGVAGVRAAHVILLRPLDSEAVALLAVRTVLNFCLTAMEHTSLRSAAYKVGSVVNNELVLTQIEEHNPALYHTLAHDLARRLSKDERHRMTVMRTQARDAGITWAEWPIGARDQVGFYLVGLLEQAGMVEILRGGTMTTQQSRAGAPRKAPDHVLLSAPVREAIMKIKGFVAITAPTYGPCVEPPRDWTSWEYGGFHTPKMIRSLPRMIKCHPSARGHVNAHASQVVLDAINMLQRTAWQVNRDVLDVVRQLSAAGIQTPEIVSTVDPPKPPRPTWLPDGKVDKAVLTEAQAKEFVQWKHDMAEWHTTKKLTGVKFGRFSTALRVASEFVDYPALHFVYFADSRGRFYPLTYGINPQGSDLQKSLLRFAIGKPLETPEAIRWFHILGANKFGFDKATLSERFMWAHERREWILHIVSNPLDHRDWLSAGDPLQFLAWCFEYADWVRDPDGFRSHLPVNMDGSCNGLQNLSAMLRDEVGGRATNLTDNEVMEDIYRRVAEAASGRMAEHRFDNEADESIRLRWLTHGINRSVVKRSVMTTPYGVTNRSATDYVISDYLAKGEAPCFQKSEYRKAAQVLMKFAWPAIGDVVVKGRQAMDWLKKGARSIIRASPPDSEPVITWLTPSGFPASQGYFDIQEHRITTRLAGVETIRLVVVSEGDEPDRNRHSSGLAPNFVHSLDASHLHRVAARGLSEPLIDALMAVHDDYGTHAADAQRLFELIREEFVAMYEEHDPVTAFFNLYPMVGEPPAKGTLDIREVLKSDFFFS